MNCSKRNVEKALNDDGCKDNCVLPPNWVVCKSQRKKRLYYFNKITGKSTWRPPSNGKVSETLYIFLLYFKITFIIVYVFYGNEKQIC